MLRLSHMKIRDQDCVRGVVLGVTAKSYED